jgi:hypothetical protein
MTFVEFYLWTFEPPKRREFSRVHRILRKKVFQLHLCKHVKKMELYLGSKSSGKKCSRDQWETIVIN